MRLGHFARMVQIHMSNSPRHSRPKDGVASLAYGAHHVGIMDAGVIHRPLKKSGAGRRLHFLPPQT
jgi:hypothetical protein